MPVCVGLGLAVGVGLGFRCGCGFGCGCGCGCGENYSVLMLIIQVGVILSGWPDAGSVPVVMEKEFFPVNIIILKVGILSFV